jgi:hypothetical protein
MYRIFKLRRPKEGTDIFSGFIIILNILEQLAFKLNKVIFILGHSD